MQHLLRPDHDSLSSAEARHPLDNGLLESHRVHMENAVLRVSVTNYASGSTILNVDVDTCYLQFRLPAKYTYGRVQIVVMTLKQGLDLPMNTDLIQPRAESVVLFADKGSWVSRCAP